MPTLTMDALLDELACMQEGKYIVIRDRSKTWWDRRVRNGFFRVLEEMEAPVKVVHGEREFYFRLGFTKDARVCVMKEIFGVF